MITLLVLILLVLILAGGGYWGYRANPGPVWPVGAMMVLLVVLVLWFAIPWRAPYP